MPSLPWLRLYTETLSDRKLKLVSAELGQPKPLIIGVWASLLMLAGESADRGRILSPSGKPWPWHFICDEIGLDEAICQEIVNAFANMGLVFVDDEGILCITKWEDRQFKSDDGYARVKKHRAKKRGSTGENGVKPSDDPEGDDDGGAQGNGLDHNQKRFKKQERNVSRNEIETPQSQIQSQILLKEDDEEARASDAHARASPEWGIFQKVYETEIGVFSPIIVQRFGDYLNDCPVDWLIEAVEIAAASNARRASYIYGILDRSISLKKSPKLAGPPGQQLNGHTRGRASPLPSGQKTNVEQALEMAKRKGWDI